MNLSLKTWVWRTAITIAIMVLVFGCIYAVENARGLRVWRQCEQDLIARGESLKWDDYLPPAVPDDQNFFKAPNMTEWFARGTNGSTTPLTTLLAHPDNTRNDITELTASNYLAWCVTVEPELSQMRDALKRPAARIDGSYSRPFETPMANWVTFRLVGQVMAHRARCHLILGRSNLALDDLTLLHQLNGVLAKLRRPPLLVNAMIYSAISGIYVDTVACGLDAHLWRDEELSVLQKQLAEDNLLPALADALHGEQISICHLLDNSTADQFIRVAGRGRQDKFSMILYVIPSGWIDQNKAVVYSLMEKFVDCIDTTNRTVSPFKVRSAQFNVEVTFRKRTPYNFFAAVALPSFLKASQATARNQTWLDQARIACALERFRLVHGGYPDTLAQLLPQFLDAIPRDVVTGKAMSYNRVGAAGFDLYSIGWNELDDGGTTMHTGDGKEDSDFGDWVWQYPRP